MQLDKKDELFESVSALNLTQALDSLNTRSVELFRSILVDLRSGSKGQISTKMAAEIASNLAIGLYGKIYSQIEPDQIGSLERDLHIASDYGKRLQTDNVKPGALDKLINGYPSHSFIIDRGEADSLFKSVREPDEDERALAESIVKLTREPVEVQVEIVFVTGRAPISGKRVRLPSGEGCRHGGYRNAVFGNQINVTIDEPEAEVIRGESDLEVDDMQSFQCTQITEVNVSTGHCILNVEGFDRPITGKISDPALSAPNNVYTKALNEKIPFRFSAKPVKRDGVIQKLYISDAKE